MRAFLGSCLHVLHPIDSTQSAWSHVQAKYANTNLLLPTEQLLGISGEAAEIQAPIVEQFVSAPLPRDEKLALVDDWNCLRVSLCSLACSQLHPCLGACQELLSQLEHEAEDLQLDACILKEHQCMCKAQSSMQKA